MNQRPVWQEKHKKHFTLCSNLNTTWSAFWVWSWCWSAFCWSQVGCFAVLRVQHRQNIDIKRLLKRLRNILRLKTVSTPWKQTRNRTSGNVFCSSRRNQRHIEMMRKKRGWRKKRLSDTWWSCSRRIMNKKEWKSINYTESKMILQLKEENMANNALKAHFI